MVTTGCGFHEAAKFVCEPHQDWIWWSARPDRLKSGFADVTDGWKSKRASDSNEIER
jgi:hypothetical protein